jgi:chromosome segregation ATPase
MKQKIGQIEAKKDELESAIRGIQGQMRALTDKHGSDDLKVVFDESNKHLMQLRDQVRSVQLKLEAAKATLAKQDDPAAAMTPEIIAQNDPTMRQYLANLDTMTFQLQQLARTVGVKNPTYIMRRRTWTSRSSASTPTPKPSAGTSPGGSSSTPTRCRSCR